MTKATRDRPIYVFRLTSDIALYWTSLSIVLFLVTAAAIATFYQAIHGYGRAWIFSAAVHSQQAWQTLLILLYFLAIPIGTFIVHELIHGLAFTAFGGKPRYGVGVKFFLPYAYATAPGTRFERNAFLVISLAPLVVIDALALLLMAIFPQAPWLGWIVILNTSGASGDLWLATLLLRCPATIEVEDRKAGIAIYAPPDVNTPSLPFGQPSGQVRSAMWRVLNLTLTVVALLVLVSFFLPVVFDIIGVPSFFIGTEGFWLLRWESSPRGFSLAFNPWLWLAIAVLFGLVGVLVKSASDRHE
ncbi:DUF3267 domain-containing protein [Chroococcidiopsis sp. FACHB-1243]|uniref:DUF3267 domain-containing protein n=1 Tax=Chroococcidiopsis sp. [FACHB-1243] TaxID=2692781 RepID=UPI00177DA2DC|nr:DUF3267 domain-containing protein [Chroococcidiopsis sp. [FACHB-1243]]MBD2307726.1 DUF3267 domain-containing protein [Chroococcidiopsis sp. [FACHB-1243]]